MKEKSKAKSNYFVALEKIVAKRTELGITQLTVAEHLNLSEGGYFKVEKGKTKLDLERLFKILELFEISPEEFLKDVK